MRREDVDLTNWTTYPALRWGFVDVDALVTTARVERGTGPARPLRDDPLALDELDVALPAGGTATVREICERGHSDGCIAVHRDRVVLERYRDGFGPADRHLLQSVSKSIAGSLTGVLVAERLLAPDDLVTAHVPELGGTSFEGATVRHLLDMRAGTAYSEDYDDPESDIRITEELAGWRPRRPRPYADVREQIAALGNVRDHGAAFEYRSILTDVLAWVLERAAGMPYPELLADRVWGPIGAEHAAAVTVGDGFALADGGVCATLRDLARFGLAHLGPEPRLPAAWLDDTRRGERYRNMWWVLDRDRIYAWGIHGQLLYLDLAREVVCAKLATEPDPVDERVRAATLAAFAAIAEHCAGVA